MELHRGTFLFAALFLLAAECLGSAIPVSEGEGLHWGAWSQCSKMCGGGQQERRMICDEGLDPETCVYRKSRLPRRGLRQTLPCNTQDCEVTGTWSAWGEWQPCSSTCGEDSFQLRFRRCEGDNETGDVQPNCDGQAFEWAACEGVPPCPNQQEEVEDTIHPTNIAQESYNSFFSFEESEEQDFSSSLSSSW